ncbi:hypothetical protein N9948_00880 [bacterium]|nr:hypothetical protein [bacterium]
MKIKDKVRFKLAEFGVISAPVTEEKLISIIPKVLRDKVKPAIDWTVKNKIEVKPAFYYVNNYKKNIEDDRKLKELEKYQEDIKHFSDLAQTGNIQKLKKYKWDESKELKVIIPELKKIEEEWQKNLEDEKNKWIKEDEEPNKKEIVKVDNKFSWWDLKTNESEHESRAMGHCGTDLEAKTLLSLRESKKEEGEIIYKPNLTFSISRDKHLLQMKGPHNQKPNKKYHKAILKLLNSDHVGKLLGGDYKPETDFSIHDLEEGDIVELGEIKKKKPDIYWEETFKDIDSLEKLEEKLKGKPEELKSRLKRKWVYRNSDKLSDKEKRDYVKKSNSGIHYIKDPSEELQLLHIKEHKEYDDAISAIRKPTEKVQLKAIENRGFNIQYINKPTEKVQLEAVKELASAISYIKNPSEKVQLEAVKSHGDHLRRIKNPSEKVQLEAVKGQGTAIEYIENPSEKVQLEAVKSWGPEAIEYIENPTDKVKELAKTKKSHIIARVKEKLANKYKDNKDKDNKDNFEGSLEEWKKAVLKNYPKANFAKDYSTYPNGDQDYGAFLSDMSKSQIDDMIMNKDIPESVPEGKMIDEHVGHWNKNNKGYIK